MSNLNHTQKLERELATERKACEAFAELNVELEQQLVELKTSEETLLRANDLMVEKNREKNEQLATLREGLGYILCVADYPPKDLAIARIARRALLQEQDDG